MADRVPSVYLVAYGRTEKYFEAIRKGTAPSRFTTTFLENLGFKSKNDRIVIPLLKALGFLDESNVPTSVYREYLDPDRSRIVLGKRLLAAYGPLFELLKDAHTSSPNQLTGKFKTLTNATDKVATCMANTFARLAKLADVEGARREMEGVVDEPQPKQKGVSEESEEEMPKHLPSPLGLSYTIEIHLPNTTDVEVFRAIFRALRENLAR